jgi:selenocysteine lyase/cysteine desulfurase
VDPTLLYLDTARLGRMAPRAQLAHLDFARLAGDEGGSLVFERFLREGVGAWSAAATARYPGLACWRGVGPLKESLRLLAGGQPELPVLLASRSAELMRFAARLLCRSCGNVLVTDLGWPGYHDILFDECRRANRLMTTVPIRDAILQRRLAEEEVVELLRAEFLRQRCDGLFLTAVSNLGVHLPVERVVRAVEASGEVWFTVIDGAQDFCHVSSDLRNEYCDLYLTGCHKWLRAYHPMGLGFYGRRRSRSVVETVLMHLLRTGELDDPLLKFSGQLESDAPAGTVETVNLAALFTCQGAAAEALALPGLPRDSLASRLGSLSAAAELAAASGWQPLLPEPALRSGILLLEAEREATRRKPPEEVRAAFSDQGVALTTYEGGHIRLSMPDSPWRPGEAEHLRMALRSVG